MLLVFDVARGDTGKNGERDCFGEPDRAIK